MFKGVTFLSTRLGVPHVLSPVAQATGFANETSKGQRDVQKIKAFGGAVVQTSRAFTFGRLKIKKPGRASKSSQLRRARPGFFVPKNAILSGF